MSRAKVQEKIQEIEAELELLKRSVSNEPNFSMDEKNWEKIAKTLKNARKNIYQKEYGSQEE